MAYRFFSDSVTSTADGVDLISAANRDTIVFTRTAQYIAAGHLSRVLSLNKAVSVTIDGQLYSGDGPTVSGRFTTSTYNDFTIGAGGIVRSAGDAAFSIAGLAMTLTNRGEISGALNAIASTTNTTHIVNDGTISAKTAISATGTQTTIANHATIAGTVNGVYVSGGAAGFEPIEVTNSGTISGRQGSGVYIYSQYAVEVSNSGTIDGRIGVQFATAGVNDTGSHSFTNEGNVTGRFASFYGANASDTVVNHGALTGDVYLNLGDDSFDSRNGRLSGVIHGDGGNDTLLGSLATGSILDGGDGDDTLQGGDANDILIAGAGTDIVDGGAGRDIYSFRGTFTDVTFSLDASLSNSNPDGDALTSIEGLEGGSGNDHLNGDASANWLYGRDGADFLDGRGGDDTLIGGAGFDYYYVDSAGDRVVERVAEGTDKVFLTASSLTYTLPANVENIQILGAGDTVKGNALDNVITGSGNVDIIDGGLGNDTLTGSNGPDRFTFSTPASAANADTITDFTSGSDILAISRDVFGLIYQSGGQRLNPNNFVEGTAAQDGDDRIVWDSAAQNVYYDSDGVGGVAQVLLVHFSTATTLVANDILPI